MLINLSNHPSQSWSEAQQAAAKTAYTSIHDLQFPAVNPHAPASELDEIAKQLAQSCQAKLATATEKSAVMIAGEQGLLFRTVSLLKQAGVVCLSATSERKVVQQSATEKRIEFSFVQFREF